MIIQNLREQTGDAHPFFTIISYHVDGLSLLKGPQAPTSKAGRLRTVT